MALPVDAWKLEGISPRAYQHPADRAATAALQRVPYLDEVVRQLIALGYERALRAVTLGAAVRLGERQLPGVWRGGGARARRPHPPPAPPPPPPPPPRRRGAAPAGPGGGGGGAPAPLF